MSKAAVYEHTIFPPGEEFNSFLFLESSALNWPRLAPSGSLVGPGVRMRALSPPPIAPLALSTSPSPRLSASPAAAAAAQRSFKMDAKRG